MSFVHRSKHGFKEFFYLVHSMKLQQSHNTTNARISEKSDKFLQKLKCKTKHLNNSLNWAAGKTKTTSHSNIITSVSWEMLQVLLF